MNTTPITSKRSLSPLLYPAALLSLASLAWTTWSLVDLLGTGLIGATVAAGADIIWGSVIIAEARGLRINVGKKQRNIVPAFGWVTLLIVAAFLALHGIEKDSIAMAAAGPFLPFGAKAVWVLALADMRDPAALTDDEKHALAAMERGMTFEEAQHRITMRQREMDAELLMKEVSTDFDIKVMRQDFVRELDRRSPLELATGDAPRIAPLRLMPHQTDDATPTPGVSVPGLSPARALGARTAAVDEAADQTSDTPQMRPVPASVATSHDAGDALQIDPTNKAAAIRAMRDTDPTASAPQIVKRLADHGIDTDAAYVRTTLHRIKQQQRATDGGYL